MVDDWIIFILFYTKAALNSDFNTTYKKLIIRHEKNLLKS